MTSNDSRVQAHWLTGKGPGALSVLKVSGNGAWSLLRSGFRSVTNASLPDNPAPGSAWLGTFPDSKGRGDQVLLLWRECSGLGHAEIQSHHGLLADKVLANQLGGLGIAVSGAEPKQWVNTQGFASSRDFFEQEKLVALAHCPNRIWVERVFGWSDHDWPNGIASIRAGIESGDWDKATNLVEKGLSLAPLATRMIKPFEVLIAGPPNAGKSSLMNRLLGYDRAIVSSQAGTTRDLVTGQISLGGWLVNLTDSAGLREAEDPLEAQGIQKALGHGSRVDAVIWVSDISAPSQSLDEVYGLADALGPMESGLGRSRPLILVQNKADLLPADRVGAKQNSPTAELSISAMSGLGVDRLLEALGQNLGLREFPKGLPIPFTNRLTVCLHTLLDLIKREMTSEALQLLSGWGVPFLFKESE